jgi:anti-sigma regulatory factor (Ser/Thr protein kinase)
MTAVADAAMAPRLVSSSHEPVATVSPGIRRYLRVLLVNWGLDDETVEDAVVVAEELVANVVDHAHTRFALVVRLSSRVLRIAVHDGSASDPVLQPFDPHAGRGRGLQMVANLSERWGCDHHDGGKTVWADLAA